MNSSASPALLGLACGIAFLVLFSTLSYRIPAYFDTNLIQCGHNEPMHMYFYESLNTRHTMMSPYDVSKARWQGFIKSHHGEWGAVGALAGLSSGSPALTGIGLGLMAHDWRDKDDWFKTRKY